LFWSKRCATIQTSSLQGSEEWWRGAASVMDSFVIGMVIVPGMVALVLFLVFTYLYEQSRQQYFRAWQMGWAAYTLQYALDAFNAYRPPSLIVSFVASLLLVFMALCILVSTRLMRERFRVRASDIAIAVIGAGLAFWNVWSHVENGVYHPEL